MHPESRHARASLGTCRSPALPNSSRRCFPTRLHPRQGKRQPAHQTHRRHADLRFAAPASRIETIVYDSDSGAWQKPSLNLPPGHDGNRDTKPERYEAR